MGGAPNYSKGRSFLRRISEAERKKKEQNIMVKKGKGKYPNCLKEKRYEFCPTTIPEDPLNVPDECKTCPHFLNSKFYTQTYMTHEKRIELWKRRGLPLVIKS